MINYKRPMLAKVFEGVFWLWHMKVENGYKALIF